MNLRNGFKFSRRRSIRGLAALTAALVLLAAGGCRSGSGGSPVDLERHIKSTIERRIETLACWDYVEFGSDVEGPDLVLYGNGEYMWFRKPTDDFEVPVNPRGDYSLDGDRLILHGRDGTTLTLLATCRAGRSDQEICLEYTDGQGNVRRMLQNED